MAKKDKKSDKKFDKTGGGKKAKKEKKADPGPSVLDPELYERLREEGNSKKKAARIANAAATEGRSTIGKRGGTAEDYPDRTKAELMARARELDIPGRSTMTKDQLIDALRNS